MVAPEKQQGTTDANFACFLPAQEWAMNVTTRGI